MLLSRVYYFVISLKICNFVFIKLGLIVWFIVLNLVGKYVVFVVKIDCEKDWIFVKYYGWELLKRGDVN